MVFNFILWRFLPQSFIIYTPDITNLDPYQHSEPVYQLLAGKVQNEYRLAPYYPLQCSGLVLILHTYPYPYPSLLNPNPAVSPFNSQFIFPHHAHRSPSFYVPLKKTKTYTKSNIMPVQLVLVSCQFRENACINYLCIN